MTDRRTPLQKLLGLIALASFPIAPPPLQSAVVRASAREERALRKACELATLHGCSVGDARSALLTIARALDSVCLDQGHAGSITATAIRQAQAEGKAVADVAHELAAHIKARLPVEPLKWLGPRTTPAEDARSFAQELLLFPNKPHEAIAPRPVVKWAPKPAPKDPKPNKKRSPSREARRQSNRAQRAARRKNRGQR